jgi:hypothetical protein
VAVCEALARACPSVVEVDTSAPYRDVDDSTLVAQNEYAELIRLDILFVPLLGMDRTKQEEG